MRIPRTLALNGAEWTVELAEDIEAVAEELGFPEGESFDGLTDHKNRVIYIDKDLDDDDRGSTLYHEIKHVVLPHWPEERIAEAERAMWPALRDNGLWRRR